MWVENEEAIDSAKDFWRMEHNDYNISLFEEEIKELIKKANNKGVTPETLKSYFKNSKKLEFIKWEVEI